MSRPGDGPAPPADILVVDDHADNRDLLKQWIAALGHRGWSAGDGREALAFLATQAVDLVLLDVLMPQMDGFAALERIKAGEHGPDLPVIMVSGLGETDSVARCLEAGAEDYLTKPFDPVILRARINACLEKKRLRDADRRRAGELERALVQLKAAQDQLVTQAQLASLGTLTAGIAHEMRNPLNFITNFAELSGDLLRELSGLLSATPGPQRDRDVAELLGHLESNVAKIQAHGRRADRIVAGMLLHARGQAGELRVTDLNALTEEYVALGYHGLRGQNPTLAVRVETAFDRGLAPVAVFPQELSRVIVNLTLNACYAAEQKRRRLGGGFQPLVRVTTHGGEQEAVIRVRDNGDGISPAVRERIFMPFFTTKPVGEGTGLGLSLSYDIVVRLHRGRLTAESVEGEFAEFLVALPTRIPGGSGNIAD